MIDALKEEAIVNKVGGRFKLSTLIQMRVVALKGGARPLVDLETKDMMEVAVEEIMQDKIYLDSTGKIQSAVGESGPSSDGPSVDLSAL